MSKLSLISAEFPMEIVYDQDKVFIVSENSCDIILTDVFRSYTRKQSFQLYFCRKSDPQSKGKVENLVKYVKQNFLYNVRGKKIHPNGSFHYGGVEAGNQ